MVQVLRLLGENLSSTPQSLGEPQKETPEELQERHERVLAATCATAGALVQMCKQPSGPRVESYNELLDGISALTRTQAFLKGTLQSKAARVRRAAYALVGLICRESPGSLEAEPLSKLAPVVLGALGDKDPANHAAMWDMVLSMVDAVPAAWGAVNIHKAVLPKFLSLLRHGAYGSAEVSFPAVLPFIAKMPESALGLPFFQSLLAAVWEGLGACPEGAAQVAAGDCFKVSGGREHWLGCVSVDRLFCLHKYITTRHLFLNVSLSACRTASSLPCCVQRHLQRIPWHSGLSCCAPA